MSPTSFASLALLLVACTPAAAPTSTTSLDPVASAAPVATAAPADVVDASSPSTPAAPAAIACGSRGMGACGDGTFCSFPLSAHCGEADKPGTCIARPQMCTKIYAPVCGCDHKTYGSDCAAAAAGISVAATGECSKP